MKKLLFIFIFLTSFSCFSAEKYLPGEVYDITAVQGGMLIRLKGNQVPTTCPNPNGWGWMIIPEENKTMISVALASFLQGKTNATIYTEGELGGFCRVVQYDPH